MSVGESEYRRPLLGCILPYCCRVKMSSVRRRQILFKTPFSRSRLATPWFGSLSAMLMFRPSPTEIGCESRPSCVTLSPISTFVAHDTVYPSNLLLLQRLPRVLVDEPWLEEYHVAAGVEAAVA